MRKGFLGTGMAAAAALLSIVPAAAQDVQRDPDITVTGRREIKRSEANRFVRQVMTTVDGQFARFADPVCPVVIGVPEAFGDIVAARFRDVARDAGIKVAGTKCAPNIIIVVAADADKLVRGLRKQAPGLFRGMELSEIRKAMRTGPVHVWSTVETRNEDGMGASASAADGGVADSPGGSTLEGASTMLVRTASIIELSTQQVTTRSVIVIDDDAALGKSLAQLADYAAMRTLAGARPPRAGAEADTILTLFDPQAVSPPGATLIDRSYLKGLYAARPTGKGLSQASTIARTITQDSRERSGIE